ncbi:MAG: ABC transporter permease [Promethearchaeota archaeon]|nr:MAG: ABC transporter permease [Candidatus Lokiarchaeota archaeon]
MKSVTKILFLHGKNYLTITIITITLMGIVSSSIVTDYAVHISNFQATENSLVDLSFYGDYQLYQNFTQETFNFESSLPITQIFISHKSLATTCYLSMDDNITTFHGSTEIAMFIFAIDFTLFQVSPFQELVKNSHSLNNSGGVYISSKFIKERNLVIGKNFSYYDGRGHYEDGYYYVQQSLHNITLIDELVLEDSIKFMQMFGLYEYWDNVVVGGYGIMLMDFQYYEETFRTEEGAEVITLLDTNAVLSYVFDKTGVMDKRPSAISNIFTRIIDDIRSSASALGYEFSNPYAGYDNFCYPFLYNIEYYMDSFDRFRIFLILGSFPIFLFGWWVNKTSISSSMKSQLNTLNILQCKGVSKTELRKKYVLKSIIIGLVSWIIANIVSQVLSLGLRYYLFEYTWRSFFSFNRVLNIPTLLLLPISLGISFLSTLSALNTSLHKEIDILESESEQRELRIIRKQSKKRVIIFGILSLVPFFIFLFPIFGITILDFNNIDAIIYTRLVLLVNLLGILALAAPYFFIKTVIDVISLSSSKTSHKTKERRKIRKLPNSVSHRIPLQRIPQNMKAFMQYTFIIALSFTLIAQSITYNNIVERNDYETGLATDGNGFELAYEVLNESYFHFQQILQDMRNNEQIKSLIRDDISLFRLNDTEFLDCYPLNLINISDWESNFDIPRNWASLSSGEIYTQLAINGSILVSDHFLEEENYKIGDTLTFDYVNIDGQHVEKELYIIGSYTRFPLMGIQNPPTSRNIIADISFFQDTKIKKVDWIFFPNDNNINLYELFKLIQDQVYKSDPNGWIEVGSSKLNEIIFPELSTPYSKYLQIESISLTIIIVIGLTILLKRQFEDRTAARFHLRMKGVSKKFLRKIYFGEFLKMSFTSFLTFIPAYCISLQAVFALNLTIDFGIPYIISVPFIGVLLALGVFFGALLVTYCIIVWRGVKKTDRMVHFKFTIS